MAVNLYEFIPEDHVVHLHFETTGISTSAGDISSILATSEDAMELLMLVTVEQRADRGRSDGLTVMELAHCFECFGVDQLSVSISAASEEQRVVIGEVKIQNLALVHIDLIDQLVVVQVVEEHLAIVSTNDN